MSTHREQEGGIDEVQGLAKAAQYLGISRSRLITWVYQGDADGKRLRVRQQRRGKTYRLYFRLADLNAFRLGRQALRDAITTALADAYRLARKGHSWGQVARLTRYAAPTTARNAAKAYARKKQLPWPPRRLE